MRFATADRFQIVDFCRWSKLLGAETDILSALYCRFMVKKGMMPFHRRK